MTEAMETIVARLLKRQDLTLATAESCTGGLVGHLITNVPGSSEYFLGGVIAYSYEAKERILGVRHATLYDHGAVSRETAVAMAHGARRIMGADVGVAVTGIAGPGGGTPDKPVGLTWVAVSLREEDRAQSHAWKGDREANKTDSAIAALSLLVEVLEARA
jgi:PncC family amidohydrolase